MSLHLSRSSFVWNTVPGAVAVLPEYSLSLPDYPFYLRQLGREPSQRFTAIIYATAPSVMVSTPIIHLIRNLSKSKYLDRVSVLRLRSVCCFVFFKEPKGLCLLINFFLSSGYVVYGFFSPKNQRPYVN